MQDSPGNREGQAARHPHEYVRGGTIKQLTPFRPATGEVRAEPVERATNAVLQIGWKQELTAILGQCAPAPTTPMIGCRWMDWDWHEYAHLLDERFPVPRVLLI